ncbi:LPXTG cell wall anchor domain-containing protein [Paenibacillus woosongensis]|uniref:LPXTG cell wall anchor domain-containing protein n=1 Tax=Paenibacillus woosongensis TaxID=307580 RepID=A0AA95IDK7_9BACL|nr:LPXTG cell wall anchor domain-containing protein [Paenibacillus woosongensis]WHX51212.1 LPXTG cell wall anchor domain-containing protein [Paenibacillus woosongensis]
MAVANEREAEPPVTPPVAPPVTTPEEPEPENPAVAQEPVETGEDGESAENASTGEGNPPQSEASGQNHEEQTNANDGKNVSGAGEGAQDHPSKSDMGVTKLPKTGESSDLPYYAAGLAIIAAGIYLRRRTTKQA